MDRVESIQSKALQTREQLDARDAELEQALQDTLEYLEAKSLGLQTNLTQTQEERAAVLLEEIKRIESQEVSDAESFRTSIEGLSESLDAHKVASDEKLESVSLAVRESAEATQTYLEEAISEWDVKFEEERERAATVATEHANALDAKITEVETVRAQAEAVRDEAVRERNAQVDAAFVDATTLIEANKIIAAEDLAAATDASEKRFSAITEAMAADKAAAAEALQAHEATVVERFSAVDERITSETAARQAEALATKEALDTQLKTMEEERVKRDEAFATAQAEKDAARAAADAVGGAGAGGDRGALRGRHLPASARQRAVRGRAQVRPVLRGGRLGPGRGRGVPRIRTPRRDRRCEVGPPAPPFWSASAPRHARRSVAASARLGLGESRSATIRAPGASRLRAQQSAPPKPSISRTYPAGPAWTREWSSETACSPTSRASPP